jgi:hypothetical protein
MIYELLLHIKSIEFYPILKWFHVSNSIVFYFQHKNQSKLSSAAMQRKEEVREEKNFNNK